jgi:hypothetical protein
MASLMISCISTFQSSNNTQSLANKNQPPEQDFLEEKDAHGKQATMKEAKNEVIRL